MTAIIHCMYLFDFHIYEAVFFTEIIYITSYFFSVSESKLGAYFQQDWNEVSKELNIINISQYKTGKPANV